ncbi:hypothetical protein [Aquipseudomonas alcaligenes]|uniref:hypothetical protein n=1 Tax=Aquipseudomonas alcaligenes TaxID=43263 RepID=UPI0012E7E7AA|nr:hypothetical protein [Pseudomonas alcaligenes]
MSSTENNSDDWREIRARADSIANAIFLISGGALSLSISVILSNKSAGYITAQVACIASLAWYCLLASLILFLALKGHMILQAYLLQFRPNYVNKHLRFLNGISWAIGLTGFISFIAGMFLMVRTAILAVGT